MSFKKSLHFIEQQDKTLFYHIADPIWDWMPDPARRSDEARSTAAGRGPVVRRADKSLAKRPSYFEIIAAGDRMLAKHPNLRVVAYVQYG